MSDRRPGLWRAEVVGDISVWGDAGSLLAMPGERRCRAHRLRTGKHLDVDILSRASVGSDTLCALGPGGRVLLTRPRG